MRGGDSGGSDRTPHRTSESNTRETGKTHKVVDQRGKKGQGNQHKNVLDPGKYSTGVVPIGPPHSVEDLYENFPTAQ